MLRSEDETEAKRRVFQAERVHVRKPESEEGRGI